MSVLLIDDDDACRDTRAVEEVRRQADDGLDVTATDDLLADVRLGVAAEENAVRKDDGSTPVLLRDFSMWSRKA